MQMDVVNTVEAQYSAENVSADIVVEKTLTAYLKIWGPSSRTISELIFIRWRKDKDEELEVLR